jgi:hypothetical protein
MATSLSTTRQEAKKSNSNRLNLWDGHLKDIGKNRNSIAISRSSCKWNQQILLRLIAAGGGYKAKIEDSFLDAEDMDVRNSTGTSGNASSKVQGETEMWCRRDGLGQLLQRHGTCRQNAR